MSEKPIIFSGEMVRAILSGRKTQTRRVIKPQPHENLPEGKYRYDGIQEGIPALELLTDNGKPTEKYFSCAKPPYMPADVLWAREIYRICEKHQERGACYTDEICQEDNCATPYMYRANLHYDDSRNKAVTDALGEPPIKWYPSIHMPRAAARIFLRVAEVRVERVQNITPEDAKAEGVSIDNWTMRGGYGGDDSPFYREAFEHLWDEINAKRDGGIYAWERNPWVWVYEFERIETTEKRP